MRAIPQETTRTPRLSRRTVLRSFTAFTGAAAGGWLLSACSAAPAAPTAAAAPTPQTVEVTRVVEKQVTQLVQVTQVVEKQVTQVVPVEVTRVVAPAVVALTVEVSANIKNEAVTGKPGEGKYGEWYEIAIYEGHLQKFMDANPKIKVVVDWINGDTSKLIPAKKAAGTLGDVVFSLGLPLDVAINNQIIRSIDDLVKAANFDLGQYQTIATDALRYDPKLLKHGTGAPLWGLPEYGNPGSTMIYYNADMFDQVGVKPPADNGSLTDLLDIAHKLTVSKPGADVADVYGWVLSPFWGGDTTWSWLRDFGGGKWDQAGQKATVLDKGTQAAVTWIYNAIYKEKVAPRPDTLAALGQYKVMFQQKKEAMYRLPPWGVLATSDMPLKGQPGYFNWDAFAVPAGPSGQHGSWFSVSWEAVTANTPYPDDAFKVVAALTDKEAGINQCYNAAMCGARQDVYDDPAIQKNAFLARANGTVKTALPPYYAANGRDSEANSAFDKEFDKVLNNQSQPDQAWFENTQTLVQAALDKPPV